MKLLLVLFLLLSLFLTSCSGGKGGEGITNLFNGESSPKVIPASQVETEKLISAVQTEPIYKIENSEIDLLKSEGIISEQDVTQLKAIQ